MSFDESVIVKMLFVLFALGMFISSVSTKAVGERKKGDDHVKVNGWMDGWMVGWIVEWLDGLING